MKFAQPGFANGIAGQAGAGDMTVGEAHRAGDAAARIGVTQHVAAVEFKREDREINDSGARLLLPGNVYNFGPDAWPVLTETSPQHPVTRKGLVQLEVCDSDGSAGRVVVTKRDPIAYRAARDASWGDTWSVPGLC